MIDDFKKDKELFFSIVKRIVLAISVILLFVILDKKDVLMKMQVEKLKFPVIIKPEIGGRGRLVSMLKDDIELKNYLNLHRERFLIQENITLPTELSVLYYRFPDVTKGNISSLCLKEPLSITGDGIHSILELLKQHPSMDIFFEEHKRIGIEM